LFFDSHIHPIRTIALGCPCFDQVL
jgi:hypothetical protein